MVLRSFAVAICAIGFMLISIQDAAADDFYWAGGTGKWSDFKNHWMKTSGGTDTQGRVPSFLDNVIFDENSFSDDDQHIQLDILNAEVNDIDFTKIDKTVSIDVIAGGRDFTVYGSIFLNKLVSSNLGNLIIASKSKDAIIKTEGVFVATNLMLTNEKSLKLSSGNKSVSKQLEKSGTGELVLMDSLIIDNQINISNGVFTSNSKFIKTSSFSSGGSSTEIDLMNSLINVNQWSMDLINSFSSGASVIAVNGNFNGGNLAYYDVQLCGKVLVTGNNTYHKLGFCEGSDIELQAGSTQLTQEVSAPGTPGKPIRLASNIFEQEAFIQQNSGVVNVTSLNLEDIHALGGANFTAENSVDLGNVQGWNITVPPKNTFYWVGGTGNWSDYTHHWATTSGGSQFHEALPNVYDDVIFDENSFSSSAEVVLDLYNAYCGNMDWSSVDDPVFFTPQTDINGIATINSRLHVFGSFIFNELASSGLLYIRFKSDKNCIVDSKGNFLAATMNFYHTGQYSILAQSEPFSNDINLFKEGTTVIEDSIIINNSLNLFLGNLVVDSSYISVPIMILYSGTIDIVKSEIRTQQWNAQNITEFKSDSSSIYIDNGGTFYGGNIDYFDVILCGRVYVAGDNTYNKLEFCPGSDIYLPANQTQIADVLILSGEPGFPTSISSTGDNQQGGLQQKGGTVSGKYLYLKDNKASGADFVATETVDLGNVTGWNISSPTPDNYYWVGGNGLWSEYALHWATTSGGTIFHDRIPGALDNVIFDENSFPIANGQVTIDQIKTYTKHLDFSGVDQVFSIYGGSEVWVFGSFLFNENGNSGINLLKFPVDTSSFEIVSEGKFISNSIVFDHQGTYDLITENGVLTSYLNIINSGEIRLNGDLNINGEFVATDGNFKSNDYALNLPTFDFGFTSGKPGMELDIGNSKITVNTWRIGDQINFSGDSSEINILNSNGNAYFIGGGKDYYFLNAACVVYFQGDNSFERLTLTYGAKIFIDGEQTVNDLVAVGTSGNPIQINGGSFKKNSGKVENQYLVLNNNKGNGGARFVAERSLDGGGNTGWEILPPEVNVDANELDVLNGEPLCGQAIETTLSLPPGLLVAFKWFKDGVELDYDSSTIVVSEEGIYYVELTNACGTVARSNEIDISREAPPDIPKIYKDGTTSICGNQPIDVKMNTDEQPRVHYQWKKDGVVFGDDEPYVTIDTVGTYSLQLVKGECLVESKDSVVVVIKDDIPLIQSLQLLDNDTICLGDSSRFFVPYEVGTTYKWNNGDTIVSTQINFFDAKIEGTYTLQMENGCGNTPASGVFNFIVKELPESQEISIDGLDTFCFYDSILLSVPWEEEVTYHWLVNDDREVKNFMENQAYSDTAGAYYVEIKNRCGVIFTDKIKINHIYLPEKRAIQMDRDSIFCVGDSVIFSLETLATETWVWYESEQTISENRESISIFTPGVYAVDITNICGTIFADNKISVDVLEIPAKTIVKDFYERCGPGELNVEVEGGTDGNFVWYDENNRKIGGLNTAGILVPLEVSKDYFVTLTNGYCEGEGSKVVMKVLEIPVADAGEDKTVIYGDEVMIGGVHDYPDTYYLWTPDIHINKNTSPTPTIWPEESIVYTLEAIGKNRCSSFDEVNIEVSFELVIPNTFTPNNDGTNDLWQIRNIKFHPDSRLEIFNRWGTKLYESIGYDNDWNGLYNGKDLPVDTYFYVIQVGDDKKPYKGPISIIR